MRRCRMVAIIIGLLCALGVQATSRKPLVVFFVPQVGDATLGQLPLGTYALLQGKFSLANISAMAQQVPNDRQRPVVSSELASFSSSVTFCTPTNAQQVIPWICQHHTAYKIILVGYSTQPLNYLWMNTEAPYFLQSAGTRRSGLLTYTEIPALVDWYAAPRPSDHYFRLDDPQAGNPVAAIAGQQRLIIALYYARMLAVGLLLLLGVVFLLVKSLPLKQWLAYLLPLLPIFFLLASYIAHYTNIGMIPVNLLALCGALATAYLLVKRQRPFGMTYGWLCLGSVALFALLTVVHIAIIYESPISYNSLLYGGRFYGLNNDVQGMMFGAVFAGIFTLAAGKRLSLTTVLLLQLAAYAVLFVIFSPLFGVNASGMLIAVLGSVVCIWSMPVTLRNRLLGVGAAIVGFVVLGQVLIWWDMQQSSASHLGHFANLVRGNQLASALSIIASKIKQILIFSLIPPVNLFVGVQLYHLYRKPALAQWPITNYWRLARRILLITAIGEYCLDDTGIIAGSIMLAYLLVPFTLANQRVAE